MDLADRVRALEEKLAEMEKRLGPHKEVAEEKAPAEEPADKPHPRGKK